MRDPAPSRITAEDFLGVLRAAMPSAAAMPCEVVSLVHGAAVLTLKTGEADLRPGGTVSGPTMFAFADLAMYAAVMTAVGVVPLAVTTDATVHFLRRPKPGVLRARAQLLKTGKKLVVGDVVIEGEEEGAPVMHAVFTYALPER
jgi:uncharacterized protein (TIGR00369 family)